MSRRDKAVPTPDVAFGRDQPLAGLELRHQLGAALARHHADLRQAARQFGWRLHMVGERHDAVGQRRIAFGDAGIGPAHRRRRIDRRIEIVAKRGADRLFKALVDGDAVDDRRPQVLGLAVDDLGDRARLGLEPLYPLVGLIQRRARGFQRLARGDVGGFARLGSGFRSCKRLFRVLDRRGQLVEIAETAGLLRELLLLGRDIGDLLVEPGELVAMGADVGL